jgi:hypothetical protein
MVEVDTVLILGAGASWDYGFPTGEELVNQICNLFRNHECKEYDYFYELGFGSDMIDKFLTALEYAKPPSVDAWLEHNTQFIGVGKIAIAIALLSHEKEAELRPGSTGDWYRLLCHRLDSPFDRFQDNKLSIITFNYDRLVEEYLFRAFRNMHTAKSKEECIEKIKQLRILHVYGCLGRLEWQKDDSGPPLPQVRYGTSLDTDTIASAADSIKIIPEINGQLPDEFQEARKLIANANALYFLGFGYNKTNMIRLELGTLRKPSKIMGTGYGLSYQRMREVKRLDIRGFGRNNGLVNKAVYEFLHGYVDFNELGLPKITY